MKKVNTFWERSGSYSGYKQNPNFLCKHALWVPFSIGHGCACKSCDQVFNAHFNGKSLLFGPTAYI